MGQAFELAVLCNDVGAAEAAAIGLASRSVPAAEWQGTVESTVGKLCGWYCRSMAEGKVRCEPKLNVSQRTRHHAVQKSQLERICTFALTSLHIRYWPLSFGTQHPSQATFYKQAAAGSLEEKYAIATPVMAGMFQQEVYVAKMRAFVDRRRGSGSGGVGGDGAN